MELAAYLCKKAASTTVVGTSSAPFEAVFGKAIGSRILQLYETNGVKFRMGVGVNEFRGDKEGGIKEVVLSDNSVLAADVCIAGIGVVPATDFLKGSGVDTTDRGFVKVDQFMRTNHPDIYACGDIVVFPLATFDNQVVNVQHWQMALKHGKTAGLAIGKKEEPILTVPFFWSVLFGKSLRYTGYNLNYDEFILHGSLEELKFVAYYLKKGSLVAAASSMRDPVATQIAQCFRSGKKISKADIEKNTADDWASWMK